MLFNNKETVKNCFAIRFSGYNESFPYRKKTIGFQFLDSPCYCDNHEDSVKGNVPYIFKRKLGLSDKAHPLRFRSDSITVIDFTGLFNHLG